MPVDPPKQRRVCVVGSLNMDLVVRAPRFPTAGETILGGEFATFPGGKGANQAVAAARMGAKVSMIGRVGDDAYGVELRRVLEAEGIDTSAVLTTANTPTGVAVITVAEGGGNTIVVAPGANGKLTPGDVEAAREKIEGADVVLMQLEVPLGAVAKSAQIAKGAGRHVMLNAAPAAPLGQDLVRSIDVLVVNETEAEVVGVSCRDGALRRIIRRQHPDSGNGSGQVADAADAVLRLIGRLAGFEGMTVVLTMGESGIAWIADRNARMIDSYRVDSVDTVGAGDAFCGALATIWSPASNLLPEETEGFALLKIAKQAGATNPDVERQLHEHLQSTDRAIAQLRLACAAGALATTRRGAIPSLPRLADVESLIRSQQYRE